MGLTTALLRTTPRAGIPIVGALAFAGVNRIGWILENQEAIKAEGATLNLDEEKLEQTMGLLAVVFVSTEIWTINRLLASPAATKALQEGLELALAGELTEEGAERVALKAGIATGLSRVLGKVLLVDTVIWAVTGAVDLGLNFTGMTEEEQTALFDWLGPFNIVEPTGGLSPLGEFVIEPVLSWAFDLIPASWWDAGFEAAKDAAEFLGLEDFIEDTAESYIESIDIELEWWLMGRWAAATALDGTALYSALNPSRVLAYCVVAIISKVAWVEVVTPAFYAITKPQIA